MRCSPSGNVDARLHLVIGYTGRTAVLYKHFIPIWFVVFLKSLIMIKFGCSVNVMTMVRLHYLIKALHQKISIHIFTTFIVARIQNTASIQIRVMNLCVEKYDKYHNQPHFRFRSNPKCAQIYVQFHDVTMKNHSKLFCEIQPHTCAICIIICG